MKVQSAIAFITTIVSAVEAGKNTTQAPTPTVTRPVDETVPPITPFPTQSTSTGPPVSSPLDTSVPGTSSPVRFTNYVICSSFDCTIYYYDCAAYWLLAVVIITCGQLLDDSENPFNDTRPSSFRSPTDN